MILVAGVVEASWDSNPGVKTPIPVLFTLPFEGFGDETETCPQRPWREELRAPAALHPHPPQPEWKRGTAGRPGAARLPTGPAEHPVRCVEKPRVAGAFGWRSTRDRLGGLSAPTRGGQTQDTLRPPVPVTVPP